MATPSPSFAMLPTPPVWEVAPQAWELGPSNVLEVVAQPETDLFLDPRGLVERLNAPRLVFPADRQFTLSARVSVDFQSTYDAGALLVYVNERAWGKVCFEFSPQQQPMIVSVVTNGRSDDCNSVVLQRSSVYLRVTRLEHAFAFHYSEDAGFWHMVRYFTLPDPGAALAGFVAQSPTGAGCRVSFDQLVYTPRSVGDIRSGE